MARRRKSASRAHARHTTALATRPNVVVVRSGGGGARRRAAAVRTVVVRGGRRAARGVARHAIPATGLALGGAILGYLQAGGHLDFLPELAGSKTLAMGVAGYFATRMTKNKYIREAGAAAITVAGFEFGREHGSGGHKRASTQGWGGVGSGGGVGPFGGA